MNIFKAMKYFLYLLVFLLPIQTRWIIQPGELNSGYFEYGTLSLYLTDILLIAVLSLYIAYLVLNRKIFNSRISMFIFWILAAGLELIVFISIFFSLDKSVAVYGYLKFLLGMGLFWIIVSASYDKIKLIYCFLAGVFLQASLGIWQFLTQSSFSSKWLGIAEHAAAAPGTSVVETLSEGRWLRAYGGLDHPNMLGGLLVIALFFVIFLIIKNCWQNKSDFLILKIFILYSLFFTFLTALFFTFSRAAWIAFLAGVLIILAKAIISGDLKTHKRLLKIICSGGILMFILFNVYGNLVLTRVFPNARLEVKSNIERIESYKTAGWLIKNNWFFGTGMGNYAIAVEKEIVSNQPAYYYQPVHNVFILIWAEVGIVGLIFFFALLLYVAFCALRKENNRDLTTTHFAILAAMVIMFFVDHWWWSLHFGVLLFWFTIGVLLKRENFKQIEKAEDVNLGRKRLD